MRVGRHDDQSRVAECEAIKSRVAECEAIK